MNTRPQGNHRRGKWLVVGLILLGLLAAGVAAKYWQFVTARTHKAQQQGSSAAPVWNRDAARAQVQELQERYMAVREHGRLDAIITAAQELTQRYPDLAEAHMLCGQAMIEAGRHDDAMVHLNRSLELNAGQAEAHCLAGTVAQGRHDLEAAARHFTSAVALEPRNARYRVFLANLRLRRGQFDDARRELLEAIRLDTANHEAYAALADVYTQQNKIEPALTQIQKAIDNTPAQQREKQLVYICKKAVLLRRDNRPDEAIRMLRSLAPRERLDDKVLEQLALSWALKNEPMRAAELYEQAFKVLPLDWHLAAGAARWRLKAGDVETAREHLRAMAMLGADAVVIRDIERDLGEGGNPTVEAGMRNQ